MDELSILLLTIPIFFPAVMGLDFGMPKESVAIWFGILVLMTVSFGLLSPPVGLNVYVVNGMARNVPIGESYRGVLPFPGQRRAAAAAADSFRRSRCGWCSTSVRAEQPPARDLAHGRG
jgi:TRAP-type C4-dicarboxylate transport system permease large subunit